LQKVRKYIVDMDKRVSFEIAKLLKDKGYPQCTREQQYRGPKYTLDGTFTSAGYANHYAAPTLNETIDWLRDNRIYIIPQPVVASAFAEEYPDTWYVDIMVRDKEKKDHSYFGWHSLTFLKHEMFNSYDEAREAAIKCCLEEVIEYRDRFHS
jgi:hypothetical protein